MRLEVNAVILKIDGCFVRALERVTTIMFALVLRLTCWAEAPIKIARMTLTIKLDRNWSSFQLANNTPPLSVTGSVIAPSARMHHDKAVSCDRNF